MPAKAPSGHLPKSEPSSPKSRRERKKKNRLVRADSLSRSHTIDVSWEHGAFFDVGDAEEAGGDALEADGEAAVRGHAVA